MCIVHKLIKNEFTVNICHLSLLILRSNKIYRAHILDQIHGKIFEINCFLLSNDYNKQKHLRNACKILKGSRDERDII